MPMPEACDVCPFNYDFIGCRAINDDAWEKYGDDWNDNVCERTDRPDYCPLKEIVRCNDCKYRGNICPDYCINLEQNTNDDFYCAYGERKG